MVYKQVWSIKNYRYVWDVSYPKLNKIKGNENVVTEIVEQIQEEINGPIELLVILQLTIGKERNFSIFDLRMVLEMKG
jgi:hypothetical protein